MPQVGSFYKRGAVVSVEAYAEVLWMPGGKVHNWANRFNQRLYAKTVQAAPTNKRPRWAHYGKPLKSSFKRAKPNFWGNGRNKMRLYGGVGSSAPYALYVNDGTGVFAGRGPYQAKILPPWQRQSPSLYEHTWKVPESAVDRHGNGYVNWVEQGTITVKGQKPQYFFDEGITAAFRSMRMRSFQTGVDPKISDVMGTRGFSIEGLVGNTPATGSFIAQLDEWREWRDEAFGAGRVLGQGYTRYRYRRELDQVRGHIKRGIKREQRKAEKRRKAALRAKKYRDRKKAAQQAKPQPQKPKADQSKDKALRAERTRFLSAMQKKYGTSNVDRGSLEFRGGYWWVTVMVKDDRGRNVFKEVRGKSTV